MPPVRPLPQRLNVRGMIPAIYDAMLRAFRFQGDLRARRMPSICRERLNEVAFNPMPHWLLVTGQITTRQNRAWQGINGDINFIRSARLSLWQEWGFTVSDWTTLFRSELIDPFCRQCEQEITRARLGDQLNRQVQQQQVRRFGVEGLGADAPLLPLRSALFAVQGARRALEQRQLRNAEGRVNEALLELRAFPELQQEYEALSKVMRYLEMAANVPGLQGFGLIPGPPPGLPAGAAFNPPPIAPWGGVGPGAVMPGFTPQGMTHLSLLPQQQTQQAFLGPQIAQITGVLAQVEASIQRALSRQGLGWTDGQPLDEKPSIMPYVLIGAAVVGLALWYNYKIESKMSPAERTQRRRDWMMYGVARDLID